MTEKEKRRLRQEEFDYICQSCAESVCGMFVEVPKPADVEQARVRIRRAVIEALSVLQVWDCVLGKQEKSHEN